MSLLKPKIFLPLCIAGILTGYSAAEYIVPRFFHPEPQQEKFSTADILAAISSQPYYFRQTTSGNYLAGQFAQRHKDWDKAATYMGRVLKEETNNSNLQKNTMILSMAAGNVEASIKHAHKVLEKDPHNVLAVLFTSLEYIKKENHTQAIATLDNIKDGTITAFIIPALKLWTQAASKKIDLSTLPQNSFYAYQALLVGNHINQKEETLTFAIKNFNIEENDLRDLEKYGDAFLVFGKIKKALEIYEFIEKQNFANTEIKNKIERLKSNQALQETIELPNITSSKTGIALVFQDMAEILLREFSDDSATIFAQMALYLDPSLSKNHALIGEVFKRHKRYDDAIKSLKKITKKSDLYPDAQRLIAELYSEQEKDDKAIEILNGLYSKTGDIDALTQVGDIYRYKEEYEQANETYTKALNTWTKVPDTHWHLYYARGMTLERLKRFDESEQDLKKALSFQPDNPYLLNYLGYSWVDQGLHLEKSLKMITRAVSILPNDGYITDSLGWVYYKMNQYEEAVPHLERAVELLPYDPTINDHLGDAYWKVGRKTEAKFQWQRALNYNENKDADLKENIEKKLISGIENSTSNETLVSTDTASSNGTP